MKNSVLLLPTLVKSESPSINSNAKDYFAIVSSQRGTLERQEPMGSWEREVFFLFTLASFLKVQQRVRRDKNQDDR